MKTGNSIYLDHAAGTFLLPEVKETIQKYLLTETANPSSIHTAGRQAAAELDRSRAEIAKLLACKPSEIIFTSGGTEANNLALLGLARAHSKRDKHIITCRTEHKSVLASMEQLQHDGYTITYLQPDSFGRIDLQKLEASIQNETCLISLMWVNNETGLIHPIEAIAELAQSRNIPFHCDAVQAVGHIPIQVNKVSVTALSFSGHKVGCPAGIGLLYLRKGTELATRSHGGSQENNLRAGTQNLLGAVAFSKALRVYNEKRVQYNRRFEAMQNQLQQGLTHIPGIQINRGTGSYSSHILSCSFHDVDGEALFIRLDMGNINVSNGSACTSGSQKPSHVLTAMGFDHSLAQASLRISLGIQTTSSEIDRFCDALDQIIHSIRRKPE